MAQSNSQFDPIDQLATTLNEFETGLAEITAILPRMEFMRYRIAEELAAVRAERERLEMFTEAEAAAQLGLKPTHLADMRRARSPHFPHIAFGSKIMYSRRQLIEICDMYAVGTKKAASDAGRVTRLKAAA